MSRAFVLHLQALDNSSVGERRSAALPIRIGRNPLNDCQVNQNFISDFHAIVEETNGRISVRDLNSKNGVFVRSSRSGAPTRIASQAAVDLAAHEYEFFVGPFLRVSLEIIEDEAPYSRDPRSSGGSVLGNGNMLQVGLPPNPPYGSPPGGPGVSGRAQGGGGVLPSLPAISPLPALDASQGARPGGPPVMNGPPAYNPHGPPQQEARPSGYPGQQPPSPQRQQPPYGGYGQSAQMPPPINAPYGSPPHGGGGGAQVYPPVGHGQQGHGGGAAGFAGTQHISLSLEALALQGLRELTASLTPGVPLETTGDIARLITKLHDTIEVFCRCFIPLREGYAQFVSQMDLQRAAMQRSMNRSRSYHTIESARDAGVVAMALLDCREHSYDAPKAIEGIFADLMIHQMALLDGVMQGVRALLDDLSPENIEKLVDEREPRGPLGLHLSVGRYKAMWETYRERYEQISDEQQAFAQVFGPEFTDAYREYRRRRTNPT